MKKSMPDGVDYYGVLGVAPDSEDIVIRAAYRVLMQKYHPDKWPDASSIAENKARAINQAYAVLNDPEARSNYDARRRMRSGAAVARSRPSNGSDMASSAAPTRHIRSQLSGSAALRVALGAFGLVVVAAMLAALIRRDHLGQTGMAGARQSISTTQANPIARPSITAARRLRPETAGPSPKPPVPPPDAARRTLVQIVGAWKLAGASDCSAPYRLAADGNGSLTLTGPDGTQQHETILGMKDNWLHTVLGDASSFYRLDGASLVYRYGSEASDRSETRFVRCE